MNNIYNPALKERRKRRVLGIIFMITHAIPFILYIFMVSNNLLRKTDNGELK
jgi:hypothetical protein